MKKIIVGISTRIEFGDYKLYRVYVFTDRDLAEEWLYTEEYDFRIRELLSKTEAIKMYGRKVLDGAVDGDVYVKTGLVYDFKEV